jgi:hypothetical protein
VSDPGWHDSSEALSDAGGWGEDVLEEARKTIVLCMRYPGRNAMVQLAAAKTILAKDFLAHLPDEQLLAEVERRAGIRKST